MTPTKASRVFQRADACEANLCVRLNQACHGRWLERLLARVSRLGDGVFWYTLVLALPVVYGGSAVAVSARMGAVGLAGVAIYKLLKAHLERDRPFVAHGRIHLGAAPLDRHSFPSGHTLHAVGFTVVATAYLPELGWLLVPFSMLVALSRVVLGLHYPSDVLAGALIGASLGLLVVWASP